MNEYTLHSIEVDSIILYYWELNSSLKKTIILLHGLGGDHRGLCELGLLIKGYRLILIDLPGYGLSEPLPNEYTLKNYADFIDLFRDKIGLKKFILAGHSYGGTIAIKYAEFYPNNLINLILINPISHSNHTLTGRVGIHLVNFASHFSDKTCRFLLSNKFFVYMTDRTIMTRSGRKRRKLILNEDYLNYKRADLRAIKEGMFEMNHILITRRILRYLNNCLVIGGDRDPLVKEESVEQLSSVIKDSVLVYTSGGHLFPLEDPPACARIINYYLANNKNIFRTS